MSQERNLTVAECLDDDTRIKLMIQLLQLRLKLIEMSLR